MLLLHCKELNEVPIKLIIVVNDGKEVSHRVQGIEFLNFEELGYENLMRWLVVCG